MEVTQKKPTLRNYKGDSDPVILEERGVPAVLLDAFGVKSAQEFIEKGYSAKLDEAKTRQIMGFLRKTIDDPESLFVIPYETFETQISNLEVIMKHVERNKDTGMYKSLRSDQDSVYITTSASMYFELLNFIFGCDCDFVEGYNLIETWCIFYDFGKNFTIGDIVNNNLPPSHPMHKPDLSDYRKFYEYLCIIKAVNTNLPKELLEVSKRNIVVKLPSAIEAGAETNDDVMTSLRPDLDDGNVSTVVLRRNPKLNLLQNDAKVG